MVERSLLSREFMLLWIAVLVAMMGVSMVQPLLPIFVEDELGAPAIGVALSFAGVTVASIVVSPLIGRYGDLVGPKPFLVVGFLIYAIAGLGYLFAAHWGTVVAFRVLSGVGAAGIFAMAPAYVGLLAPRGREGEIMGYFALAQVAGFGVGPLLGGALADAFSADVAFAVMALLLALNSLSIAFLLPAQPQGTSFGARGSDDGERSLLRMLGFRPTQAAMMVQAVSGFSFGAGASFLGVYVVSEQGLGTGSALLAGLLFTARSLTSGVLNPLTGRLLADRFDRMKLVVGALLAIAALQLVIPSLPETVSGTPIVGEAIIIAPWLMLVFVLMGAAESVLWPAQQAIYVDVGRHIGMGAIMAFTQWASNAGFLVGAILAGAVIVPTFGLEAVFRYTGIAVALGAVAFALMMRRAQPELDRIRAEYGEREV